MHRIATDDWIQTVAAERTFAPGDHLREEAQSSAGHMNLMETDFILKYTVVGI